MDFLNIFSLKDVFIAATGLMFMSILRIYYDSYTEKRKVKQFSNSLNLYNNTIEKTEEGLLIISDNDEIIFVNNEAARILGTNKENLNLSHLNSLHIEKDDNNRHESFMEIVQTKNNIANAYIVSNSHKLASTITTNKIDAPTHNCKYWYVVILRDMTLMIELREAARKLMSLA